MRPARTGPSAAALPQSATLHRPVLDLIRRLRAGELSGASLEVDDRRACVEYLTSEGYSVAETAGILTVADRTVLRDRRAIRESNSVERDPALAGQIVGQLLREADTAVGRLRRIARDRETPASAKVDAERGAWLVTTELVRALQRLGYLPEAAHRFQGELRAEHGEPAGPPEYDELQLELERLESIRQKHGLRGDAVDGNLAQVRDLVTRLAAGERVKLLAAAVNHYQQGGSSHDERIDNDQNEHHAGAGHQGP